MKYTEIIKNGIAQNKTDEQIIADLCAEYEMTLSELTPDTIQFAKEDIAYEKALTENK